MNDAWVDEVDLGRGGDGFPITLRLPRDLHRPARVGDALAVCVSMGQGADITTVTVSGTVQRVTRIRITR